MHDIHFYWKKTCTTSKKARDYLLAKGVELIEHNIIADPPPREFLEKVIDEKRVKSFLNTRCSMYRNRKMGQNPPDKSEAIKLIYVDPNLLKRPVVICGELYSFGFEPEKLDEIIEFSRK